MSTSYEYSMREILEIDGSVLEGGGQILRISISLSAILGIPVRVKNIRCGRPKPGLAAQHLKDNLNRKFRYLRIIATAAKYLARILLVADMCQAKLKGAELGSTEIEFVPGKLIGGTFYADTHTAGSISLLLQVALPCALYAPEPVILELKGGTNAAMAPQVDYMTRIFGPTLRNFGADFCIEIIKRGFYPRGGGHVRVTVTPVKQLRPASITERGDLERITGWSFVAGSLPLSMAQQMAQAANQVLQNEAPVDIHAHKERKEIARDNGWGILLMAELSSGCLLGADGLGGRGDDAWEVGRNAARRLQGALATGACLDQHTQDQVIIYMALAGGQSSVRVGELTLHSRTAMHVARLIANVEYSVIPLSDEHVIQCVGRGVVNKYVY